MDGFTTVFVFTNSTDQVFSFPRQTLIFGLGGIIAAVFVLFRTWKFLKSSDVKLRRKLVSVLFTAVWMAFWTSMVGGFTKTSLQEYARYNQTYLLTDST